MTKYAPPLAVGTRVRLTVDYSDLHAGEEGEITWTHPWPSMPYRVKFDNAPGYKRGDPVFGMDDVGWLMKPEEIEEVRNDQPDKGSIGLGCIVQ